MKKEDLFEAMDGIDEKDIKEAGEYRARKRPVWVKWVAIAACAVVCIVLVATVYLAGSGGNMNGHETAASVSVEAAYPSPVSENMSAQEFREGKAHDEWWNEMQQVRQELEKIEGRLGGIYEYYEALMAKIHTSDESNTVCSPLNTYFAFAMLAEVSEGNTRQQILDMLGAPDIETLRENVHLLWQSNYADTPILKSLLANSIWLNDSMEFNMDTLRTLAETYYASAFSGDPESKEMSEKLRSWMDANTGGMLSEYIENIELDPRLVMAIVSTIYYKAEWQDHFNEENTDKAVFHGANGDTEVDMMHKTEPVQYCKGDKFTAIAFHLNDSGDMYFYLPNEGISPADLFKDPELLDVVRDRFSDKWSYPMANISVPKFSVSSETDLLEILKELGVTDALDPEKADFTPLTDSGEIFLGKAKHAAVVETDEVGVSGAAYTILELCGAGMINETVDFVLDRPFAFVITGMDGSVLFSGTVNNIE